MKKHEQIKGELEYLKANLELELASPDKQDKSLISLLRMIEQRQKKLGEDEDRDKTLKKIEALMEK